ncbi:hypothetical protein AZA_56009 [Nitrospirillum viridazoti Y2]|nr:hypothetical protein AZA_56009 [Nitrospirillum amazonense Y2]
MGNFKAYFAHKANEAHESSYPKALTRHYQTDGTTSMRQTEPVPAQYMGRLCSFIFLRIGSSRQPTTLFRGGGDMITLSPSW